MIASFVFLISNAEHLTIYIFIIQTKIISIVMKINLPLSFLTYFRKPLVTRLQILPLRLVILTINILVKIQLAQNSVVDKHKDGCANHDGHHYPCLLSGYRLQPHFPQTRRQEIHWYY